MDGPEKTAQLLNIRDYLRTFVPGIFAEMGRIAGSAQLGHIPTIDAGW